MLRLVQRNRQFGVRRIGSFVAVHRREEMGHIEFGTDRGAASIAISAPALVRLSADEEIEIMVEDFGRNTKLSPRQCEMVKLAVAGIERKESAFRLDCSLKTIEGYWRRIHEKTGCRSDSEVVAKFIRDSIHTLWSKAIH
jgi:DNA-binding CsgD family transcriptional regulator